MSATAAAVSKATAFILGDERGRRALGWILAAVLAPLILIIVFVCAIGSSTAAPLQTRSQMNTGNTSLRCAALSLRWMKLYPL